MSIARPVQGYQGLVEACRARAQELEISRSEIDRLAGLATGYSGKLLGKEGSQRTKRMWPVALEAVLGVLGLQVILIEDSAATARTLARREPVDSSQQRFGDYHRGPQPRLLEAPCRTEANAA